MIRPARSPIRIGGITLRVASRPKSSTEKAGVPNHDVHRYQLDTPPRSLQPLGVKNKNHPTVTTTPTVTETMVRVSLSIESEATELGDSVLAKPDRSSRDRPDSYLESEFHWWHNGDEWIRAGVNWTYCFVAGG